MFYWTSDHSSGHHGGNAVLVFLCILKDPRPLPWKTTWGYLWTSNGCCQLVFFTSLPPSLCEELRLLYNTNSLCTCFLSSAMVMLLRNLQSLVWEVSRQDQIDWIRRLENCLPLRERVVLSGGRPVLFSCFRTSESSAGNTWSYVWFITIRYILES